MAAADLQALFQGVLTPQAMDAQEAAQEQQMMAVYAQQGQPWQFALERSLNQLGRALPNSPYQQQRRQAEANQEVLKGSTRRYADLISTGSDPSTAQLQVVGDAIDEFARQGNYEAISKLAPSYLALQTKQAEMSKLKQQERTAAAQELKARTETAAIPIELERKGLDSESTRATQSVQRRKDEREMAETEGGQILDLTDPKAGPVVASIDPVTRNATITDAAGSTKVLKPGQYKDMSKVSGSSEKPIPRPVANDLSAAGESLDTTQGLIQNFKPSFGGYKLKDAGDIDMFIKKNLAGDKSGAADWWATYQAKTNVVRNKLFGSALTATEKAEWDKAAINPGMRPEVIQANLKRQEGAERKAAQKLGKGWSMTYGQDQVEAFLGRPLDSLEASGAPTAAPAGAGEFDYVPGKGLVQRK